MHNQKNESLQQIQVVHISMNIQMKLHPETIISVKSNNNATVDIESGEVSRFYLPIVKEILTASFHVNSERQQTVGGFTQLR